MKQRLQTTEVESFWNQADRLAVVLQVLRDRLHNTRGSSEEAKYVELPTSVISHWLFTSHRWLVYLFHNVDINLAKRIQTEEEIPNYDPVYLSSLQQFKQRSRGRVIAAIRQSCDYDRQRSIGGKVAPGRFQLTEINRGEYLRYLALLPCAEDGGDPALPIAAKLADLQRMLCVVCFAA